MTSFSAETTIDFEGKVKWFNKDKGFGVVTYVSDDSGITEYFIHHSNITSKSSRCFLEENEEIIFSPSCETGGKLKALNIRPFPNKTLACDIQKTNHDKKNTSTRVNTTTFKPQTTACDIRLLTSWLSYENLINGTLTTNDIVILDPFVPNFGLWAASNHEGSGGHGLPELKDNSSWFNFFKEELNSLHSDDLMKLWHGDSHLIADDKLDDGKWKEKCPRLTNIINVIACMFKMNVTSTRVNEYRDGSDWKPYHHDAAALKEHIKKIQNITVAVSFGGTRTVAFQHAKNGNTVSIPIPDGHIYSFGQQVNIDYRHGIIKDSPHIPPRISIILWGWVEQSKPAIYT